MDRYIPNPKHKEPWQRGRKGALCGNADGPDLFASATPDPSNPHRRWATDGQRFYAAQSARHLDANGDMLWHGYPVGHLEVPAAVMAGWVKEGIVSRRAARGRST
jgi:hypothetical protein